MSFTVYLRCSPVLCVVSSSAGVPALQSGDPQGHQERQHPAGNGRLRQTQSVSLSVMNMSQKWTCERFLFKTKFLCQIASKTCPDTSVLAWAHASRGHSGHIVLTKSETYNDYWALESHSTAEFSICPIWCPVISSLPCRLQVWYSDIRTE